MPNGPLRRPNPSQPAHPPGPPKLAASSRLQLVLSYFAEPRPRPGGWSALCPAHDDQNPSLSISLAGDGPILVHCHAGCAFADVLEAAGLQPAALFPNNPMMVATYDYRAEGRGQAADRMADRVFRVRSLEEGLGRREQPRLDSVLALQVVLTPEVHPVDQAREGDEASEVRC